MITRIFLLFLLFNIRLFSSTESTVKTPFYRYGKAIMLGGSLFFFSFLFYYYHTQKSKNKKPALKPLFAQEIIFKKTYNCVAKTSEAIIIDVDEFHEPIKKREFCYPGFLKMFETGLQERYFRNSIKLTDYFLNEKNSDGKTITQLVLEMPQFENELKVNLLWFLCGFPYVFDEFPQYEPKDPRTEEKLDEYQKNILINQNDLKSIFFFLSELLTKIHYNLSTWTQQDMVELQQGFVSKKTVPDHMYRKTVFLALATGNNITDPEIQNNEVQYYPSNFKFENTPKEIEKVIKECNGN